MEMRVPQHEHPLHLRDLMKEYEEYEDEHEEEIEDEDIIIPQDFLRTCTQCEEEINWFHRYFYECAHSCDFSLHEFCAKLPATLNHKLHSAHTLTLFPNTKERWRCDDCRSYHPPEKSGYGCLKCNFSFQNYTDHKQHTLILQPNASDKFFYIFDCAICKLSCNGFVYTCLQCDYRIDVKCAFIPEKITHEAHPGHLMSRVVETPNYYRTRCCVCNLYLNEDSRFSFFCHTCNVRVDAKCAMLLPREIKHMYDKHPLSISYSPIENHKSQYFCEICEEEMNPEFCFYHCYQCGQSIHSYCAPQILQSERASYRGFWPAGVYWFVNIKFGGMHNIKDHPHPLIFDQGIQSDGNCSKCSRILNYEMIFKCQQCKYAIDLDCCKSLSS